MEMPGSLTERAFPPLKPSKFPGRFSVSDKITSLLFSALANAADKVRIYNLCSFSCADT